MVKKSFNVESTRLLDRVWKGACTEFGEAGGHQGHGHPGHGQRSSFNVSFPGRKCYEILEYAIILFLDLWKPKLINFNMCFENGQITTKKFKF